MARTPVTSNTHSVTGQVQVLSSLPFSCSGECPWTKAQNALGKAPRQVTVHENGIVLATPHDDHVEKVVGRL